MITLYTLKPSGNAHKIRMALAFLGLPYTEVMPTNGDYKRAPFVALNPLGQVPVFIDGDVTLRDSQAILIYLAARYRPGDWDGHDAAQRGRIAQWLALAGNEIANGLARLRLAALFGTAIDRDVAGSNATRALSVIEDKLDGADWLEGGRLTIADIACSPYVGLAHQGGVSLAGYPRAAAWQQRIADLPDFPPMPGWGVSA